MITPRATRLVRVADIQAFREAAVVLALDGPPLAARDRLVVVPTRAAAAHLLRSIEDTLSAGEGRLLPDLITAGDLIRRLALRLPVPGDLLEPAEREVLLAAACRVAQDAGAEPPFQLRPGLIAEMLGFYDALRRNRKDVDTFERLALGALEPGASYDRGAERLVRQTRFLAAAFREFERRSAAAGLDEHALRDLLLRQRADRPYRHVVLTVTDRAFDAHGMTPADWDLLARVPGLERLDVLVTDRMLAGSLHERVHAVLPGIEETRFGTTLVTDPVLLVPPGDSAVYTARDREEEIAIFARRVKELRRAGGVRSLDRMAFVVRQPLPYVYLSREVLRTAGIPCQLFDTLPLAGEPFAAALDLVFSCVASVFGRTAVIGLLRSPHFRFVDADARPLEPHDVSALDRQLSESGYLGDPEVLDRLIESWREQSPVSGRAARALRAGIILQAAVRTLRPLTAPAPVAQHLALLQSFVDAHEVLPPAGGLAPGRHLRARGAILGTMAALRDAYLRFDDTSVPFDEVAALVRRWIEVQTFAPRAGESGVHVVDSASAPFGRFEHVQLAGLVDGEWPEPPRRNIFYSSAILRDLGWPSEADRLAGARSSFADLIRLPSSHLAVSTFLLETDALVAPSALVDEVRAAELPNVESPVSNVPIFEYEALRAEPAQTSPYHDRVRAWVTFREQQTWDGASYRGTTSPPPAKARSLSALERYQDCPFRFFASEVLRLEEAPEDEDGLSPRARGRFIHEVFQRFFEAWDAAGGGTITPQRVDAARTLFADVADPLLARLPQADAALERTRLFGSAISVGVVDVVLGIEASRPEAVRERLLEFSLEGEFTLGDAERRTPLRGVADRIDLLEGGRLRVFDYKTGSAPNPRRALQVPVYALCAQERLAERDGQPWAVEDAAYVAFSGKRPLVPVVKPGGSDAAAVLADARARVFAAVDGIDRGEFPPRPHDPVICRTCPYPAVCRKDYVGDE